MKTCEEYSSLTESRSETYIGLSMSSKRNKSMLSGDHQTPSDVLIGQNVFEIV